MRVFFNNNYSRRFPRMREALRADQRRMSVERTNERTDTASEQVAEVIWARERAR